MIAAAGNRNVARKSRLGDSRNEEKKASIIDMHSPAPTIAASEEARITSFNRMDSSPRFGSR